MPKSLTDIFSTARERIQRTERYAERVRRLFAQTVNSLLALYKRVPKLGEGEMYSLDGDSDRLRRDAEAILRQLHATTLTALTQGITLEWGQANSECDKLVKTAYGKELAKSPRLYAAMQRNADALKAFIERSEMGMNLSDRVWQPVRQLRDQLEIALTVGIGEGQSAATMSRKVRQYLNDPDLMFRRFRYKDADGQWQRKWKKRVIDPETGKVSWQDYDRDSYKDQWTGRGYYKSAAANAMRLTRTETNIAYRRSDNLRWRQMDFVLGQEIQLSHNHPEPDICDDLKGRYPKDFVFDGWHPQCFCRAVPVLIDDDELERQADAWDEGRDYTPKARPVTEMPAAFRRWVKANRDDIERAARKGRAPYFIRNNAAIVDDILGNKRPLTTLEKAAQRHKARTDEQAEAIRLAWARRVKRNDAIKLNAEGIAKLAADFGEAPSLTALRKAIADGDLTAMQAETRAIGRAIASIRKQEKALGDLIPDAHKWHKQFTMAELQSAHKAVESKLAQWANLSLEEQKKKLEFEAYNFLGGNMNNVQMRYKTWEVSQAAYIRRLNEIDEILEWGELKEILKEAEKFSTRSSEYRKLLGMLSDSIANKDKKRAYDIVTKINAKLTSLQNAKIQRAEGDSAAGTGAFSATRKNKALWSNKKDKHGLYDRTSGDRYFRKFAEDDWARWTENEKDVAYLYTDGSSYINEPLYTTYLSTKYGVHGEVRDSWEDINTLTKIIQESKPFTRDVWLNRGASAGEFMGQFGLNLDDYIGKEGKLVGAVGEQKPFMSTAHSKSWGFVDDGGKAIRSVVYNLYCPKGTKGIYTEPYSKFGNGGRNWDGKTKHKLDRELEVILQRGSKLRVTKAVYENGIWFIDMDVIGQPYLLSDPH